MRLASCTALIIVASVAQAMAQQAAAPTVAVGTVMAERKPITGALDFVGRVEAVNRVQIVARVKGFLEDVRFKEGDVVKEGAPLYRIEQGLFQAAVEQAQGALERSKAAKVLTVLQLDRAEQLFKSRSGTEVARDQAKAADDQAAGTILIDEANLKTAQINLDYTDIVSPITGRIGRTAVTKGNTVGPDSGVLALIVSQDPMYVTFPVSQRELLEAQKRGQTDDIKDIKVGIRFSDGSQLRPDRHDQFRRRDRRSVDRHRHRARNHREPQGHADRRPIGPRHPRKRHPGREDRHSAGRPAGGPARYLRVRGRGRQGRG